MVLLVNYMFRKRIIVKIIYTVISYEMKPIDWVKKVYKIKINLNIVL